MNNKKRSCILLVAVILSALLLPLFTACKDKELSKLLPEGYLQAGEIATGGQSVDSANIYSLKTTSETADMLSFTFTVMSGSLINSSEQSVPKSVPKYTVTATDSPQRIRISLENVHYTDYLRSIPEPDAELFFGTFMCNTSENAVDIYLQFRCSIAFSVTTEGNILTVNAIKLAKQPDYNDFSYYVTANLFSKYVNGDFDIAPTALLPTMSKADGEYLLLSAPFKSEADAVAKHDELKSKYVDFSDRFSVIAMYDNELPIYDHMLDYIDVFNTAAIRTADGEQVIDALIPNGIYLCDTSEGGFLYAKRIESGEGIVYELWEQKKNGSLEDTTQYIDFELENIEAAEFSPDGRMLSVLENSSSGSHLYVFDRSSKELICDLTDTGFGKRISNYAWNSTGTVIYAISGTTSIQINKYDFNVRDELARTSTVYDGTVDESSLGINNGELYFVGTDENGAVIFKLRPESGTKRVFASGSAFSFSESGRFIAITTANAITTSEESEQTFVCNNTSTGESVTVTTEFPVYDFFFAGDTMLYYVEDTLSKSDTEGETETITAAETDVPKDKFPYKLYVFDIATGKSKYVCDMSNSRVAYKRDGDCIVFPYYFDSDATTATYMQKRS